MAWYLTLSEFLWAILRSFGVAIVSIFRCIVPESEKSIRDRVVLITGAAHGLGRLLAIGFAGKGAKVVLLDVNKEENVKVAKAIRESGGQAWAFDCDVSQENQVEEVGQKVRREVGPVYMLVNNAGVLPGRPLLDLPSQQIRKTLAVNTLAHLWTIRVFLPEMLERGEGHIVAIASIAGMLGAANLVDYCASKYAVIGIMSALEEELYSQGKEGAVDFTVMCPATMDTGLVQKPKSRFPWLLPVLSADDVAARTIYSVLRNKRLVVIPTAGHVIYKIANLFPPQVPVILQRFLDYTLDPNVP